MPCKFRHNYKRLQYPLSHLGKSSILKLCKEFSEINYAKDELDLNTFRAFHPTDGVGTHIFSALHGTISKLAPL